MGGVEGYKNPGNGGVYRATRRCYLSENISTGAGIFRAYIITLYDVLRMLANVVSQTNKREWSRKPRAESKILILKTYFEFSFLGFIRRHHSNGERIRSLPYHENYSTNRKSAGPFTFDAKLMTFGRTHIIHCDT